MAVRTWKARSADSSGYASIKPARGQFVLVPAQVVPEFVQVRQPDFLPENRVIALGQVPDVVEVEEDFRRRGLVVGQLRAMRAAGKQPQDVRFEALRQDAGMRRGLVVNRHGL